MKIKTVWGIFLRQFFLYKRSLTRVLEIFYWPTLDILLWGFITIYLQKYSHGIPKFIGFFLGALIFWDLFFRAQQGITVSFLEDMWARNLINIFVTPISMSEYISGLLLISLFKVLVSLGVMSVLALVFYSFNLFKIGCYLYLFLFNLIAMGWAVGVFTLGIILRFGQEAEILAWAMAFLFMPFSAVFYPVEVLPNFMQVVARLVPSSYVFEGMRSVIDKGVFPWELFLNACLLNFAYWGVTIFVFNRFLKQVLKKGIITKIGE